jgi:hypothetical protein
VRELSRRDLLRCSTLGLAAAARRAGAAGLLLVRADSAYYGYEITAAARRAGARSDHGQRPRRGDHGTGR